MVNKKLIGNILQAPLLLTVIVSFGVSVYAAYRKLFGITYGTSIFFLVIIALYFFGVFLKRNKKEEIGNE